MPTILQDLRYALRQMLHAPGFSLSVVFVLALGIGANAAMFTVLEATLFRPLSYAQAEQLVLLHVSDAKGRPSLMHLADLLVWQSRTRTLDQIAYFGTGE